MRTRTFAMLLVVAGVAVIGLFVNLTNKPTPPPILYPIPSMTAVVDTIPVVEQLAGKIEGLLPTDFPLNEADLARLSENPELRVFADSVRLNLPKYRSWVRGLRRVPSGLHLDLVGQRHEDMLHDTMQDTYQVAQIQRRITNLLVKLNPGIVAFEGNSLDHVSVDGYAGMVSSFAKVWRPNLPAPPIEEIRANVASMSTSDCTIMYLNERPNARMMGSEDFALHSLHQLYLMQNIGDADELNLRIVTARSLVALCRITQVMQTEHLQHGVIVIGFFHLPEMVAWSKALGTTGNVYLANR